MATESGLSAVNVSLIYPGRPPLTALTDISLEVPEGTFVSLIGPSGCGKSSFLRLVAGLQSPSSGAIRVRGQSPIDGRTERWFGFAFQEADLLPWRSVLENVSLIGELTGMSRSETKQRATELLGMVGLADYLRLAPGQLSGGMRHRVAIARALIHQPKVLLMDEPFSAVDELQREQLNLQLLQMWSRLKNMVLFVTHNIEEAIYLSDTVVVMSAAPGTIIRRVDIPLARPRGAHVRSTPEFISIRRELREILVDQHQ